MARHRRFKYLVSAIQPDKSLPGSRYLWIYFDHRNISSVALKDQATIRCKQLEALGNERGQSSRRYRRISEPNQRHSQQGREPFCDLADDIRHDESICQRNYGSRWAFAGVDIAGDCRRRPRSRVVASLQTHFDLPASGIPCRHHIEMDTVVLARDW